MSADCASQPFVSIVTVSLNAAGTIGDTIASVARQRTRFEIEHVCVDGGSRDGTRELIDHWAADTGRIVRVYESDSGIYDAMNKGLRACHGEYVLFLNADDYLVSADIVEQALDGLAPGNSANPDLVVGDVSMGEPGRRGVWRHRRVPRVLSRLRGIGLFPLHQGMFAKRDLLLKVGGFDARQRLAADINQYYDIERQCRPSIRMIDADVAFMRAGGAANAGFRTMWRGSVEIFAHLRRTHGPVRSLAMVLTKTLQSVSEVRYGTPPRGTRWFAASQPGENSLGERENRKSA